MSTLSRDQILSAPDLETVEVDCPEWGGTVKLRMLSAAERLRWEEIAATNPFGQRGVFLTVVAASACNDKGDPLFTLADVELLAKKNTDVLVRLATAALELNRLTGDDVDELAGNSEASPSEDSRSDSPRLLA